VLNAALREKSYGEGLKMGITCDSYTNLQSLVQALCNHSRFGVIGTFGSGNLLSLKSLVRGRGHVRGLIST
jgi:hypothetical protein